MIAIVPCRTQAPGHHYHQRHAFTPALNNTPRPEQKQLNESPKIELLRSPEGRCFPEWKAPAGNASHTSHTQASSEGLTVPTSTSLASTAPCAAARGWDKSGGTSQAPACDAWGQLPPSPRQGRPAAAEDMKCKLQRPLPLLHRLPAAHRAPKESREEGLEWPRACSGYLPMPQPGGQRLHHGKGLQS